MVSSIPDIPSVLPTVGSISRRNRSGVFFPISIVIRSAVAAKPTPLCCGRAKLAAHSPHWRIPLSQCTHGHLRVARYALKDPSQSLVHGRQHERDCSWRSRSWFGRALDSASLASDVITDWKLTWLCRYVPARNVLLVCRLAQSESWDVAARATRAPGGIKRLPTPCTPAMLALVPAVVSGSASAWAGCAYPGSLLLQAIRKPFGEVGCIWALVVGVASSSSSGQRRVCLSDARRLKYGKWNVWPVMLLVVSMVVRGSVSRHSVMLVLVRARAVSLVVPWFRRSGAANVCCFVPQCPCVSVRLGASVCLCLRGYARNRTRALVSLESDVRRALAHSWFYTTELVEKDSHNNTVAFRSPGIFERSWSRVCDRRRGDDPGCSQRSSDFAIPNQQLPMLRRALVTQPRQGKGVSCPAHYRLGCAQPCACPLPQLFSVPAREQVRLVQLRDGLRDNSIPGRGRRTRSCSSFSWATCGQSRRLGSGRCHWGWCIITLPSQGRQRFMTSRLVGLARAPQTQPKPSCSTRGSSSERMSVRTFHWWRRTSWKQLVGSSRRAIGAHFAVVLSSQDAPSRAPRARQQL